MAFRADPDENEYDSGDGLKYDDFPEDESCACNSYFYVII